LEVFGLERLAAAEYDELVVAEDLGGDWSALTRLIEAHRIPVEKIVLFSGQRFRVVQQLEIAPPGDGAPEGPA
jgi:hypothetical protein